MRGVVVEREVGIDGVVGIGSVEIGVGKVVVGVGVKGTREGE